MSEKQEVGLEEVEDFVDEKSDAEQAEKENVESKLESLQTFDLKNVSHVIIGPKSISLVPAGMSAKFTKTDKDEAIGLGASKLMEYDLEKIVGAIERASDLEKELAETKAELERVKSEHAKPKEDEEPEDEEPEEEEKAEDKPEEDEPEDEKEKEEEAKKEKEDAEVKQPDSKKKEADHSNEAGMDDLLKGLKAAKEKKIL